MYFNLDFSIQGSINRANWLKQFDLSTLTQKELNLCSDYILYGDEQLYRAQHSKDSEKLKQAEKAVQNSTLFSTEDSSPVKGPHIFLASKFTDFKARRKIYSLEQLLEDPVFNENQISEYPTKYVKPSLNKEKFKTIPEAASLVEEIDKLQKAYDKETDRSKKYFLRHWLISLRAQQYILMDSYYPYITIKNTALVKFYTPQCYKELAYEVFPRGVAASSKDPDFLDPMYSKTEVKTYELPQDSIYFDFTNYKHVRALYNNLIEIKAQADSDIESPLRNLLYTLDIYRELAHLNEKENTILDARIAGKNNEWLVKTFLKKFGCTHQSNYFSTLYTRICRKISKTARINYLQAFYKSDTSMWKQCYRCGRLLLKTTQFFMRDKDSSDGLKNLCKKCDKEMRLIRESRRNGQQDN